MLDYVKIIGDKLTELITAQAPTGAAIVNAGSRVSGFQRELYRGVADEPVVLLEFKGDTLRNRTVTFNNAAIDFWLHGQVTFDLIVRTAKNGTDVWTDISSRANKALWSVPTGLGLSQTGLKVPVFQFNPSTSRRGREGQKNVFRSPILLEVRVLKSVLIA